MLRNRELWGLSLAVLGLLRAAEIPSFENTIRPMLANTCSNCHNPQLASGGLDVTALTHAGSLAENRAVRERIMERPRNLDAVIRFVQGGFEKLDRNVKPDPGHVTARRLNRAEYSNTIRDLLA